MNDEISFRQRELKLERVRFFGGLFRQSLRTIAEVRTYVGWSKCKKISSILAGGEKSIPRWGKLRPRERNPAPVPFRRWENRAEDRESGQFVSGKVATAGISVSSGRERSGRMK